MIENILDIGIDGRGPFHSAQRIADVARAGKPDGDQAVDAVVPQHLKLAAAGGFVTGLGGFITLPVALPLNILEFYLVATRMVAAIASVRGYDIRQPEIRSAVLLTLVGADSDDLLKKAGVTATGRLSNLAAQRLPGPALMVVNKAVAFRLLSQLGKKSLTRLGKGVPLVGGAVGAGLDVYLLKRIADQARHEFPRKPRGTEGALRPAVGEPDSLAARAADRCGREWCAARSLAPCPADAPGDGRDTMAKPRWGMFRTLAIALRTATRPGSAGLGERCGRAATGARHDPRGVPRHDYRAAVHDRRCRRLHPVADRRGARGLLQRFRPGRRRHRRDLDRGHAGQRDRVLPGLGARRRGVRSQQDRPQAQTVPGEVIR